MDLLHIGLYTGTFLELIITNYILLIIFRCTLTERYRTIITLSILTALNAVQLYIQQFAKSACTDVSAVYCIDVWNCGVLISWKVAEQGHGSCIVYNNIIHGGDCRTADSARHGIWI